MDERERDRQEIIEERTSSTPGWLVVVAVLALVGAGVAFAWGYTQRSKVNELNAQQVELNATISEMRMHVDSMTSKLNDVAASQAAAAEAAAKMQQTTAAAAPANTKAARAARAANEKRFKELQTQLEDQSRQLKDTQDTLASARSDLEGNINNTRTELSGSIARTHDELVALAKRGERSYFEFDLTKSKNFQRTGPIQLSLRKADVKNKRYDLMMLVDDNRLQKRAVNLYEPIWLNTEGLPAPVQVVVNKITKNQIHGYVSAPKYKESELSAASSTNPQPPER